MQPVSHFKISQAGLIALVTTIVGQIVAFVPAFASDKQILISAASAVISAAFLIANAVHAVISSKVSVADLESGVVGIVKTEVGKIDVNALVADALKGENVAQIVRAEIAKVFAGLATPATTMPIVTGTAEQASEQTVHPGSPPPAI